MCPQAGSEFFFSLDARNCAMSQSIGNQKPGNTSRFSISYCKIVFSGVCVLAVSILCAIVEGVEIFQFLNRYRLHQQLLYRAV